MASCNKPEPGSRKLRDARPASVLHCPFVTTLGTRRFLLVPPSPDDVPALAEHWRDCDVREYLWDDRLVELDVVRTVVATSMNDHARCGWGGWVIRTSDEVSLLAGCCGLSVGPPDGSAASELLVELTYSLDPAWWRTGAAVEAATVVLDHVFTRSALDAVFGGLDAPNVRSAATLHRLGFVPDREVLLDVGPTQFWRLGRDDWLDRRHPRT